MMLLSLLDVAPDPVGGGFSIVLAVLLVLIVLAVTATCIGGLVFLIIWRKKRKAGSQPAAGFSFQAGSASSE
jgi:hypothetical protein